MSGSYNFISSFVIPHHASPDRKKLALRRKVLIKFRSAVRLIVNRQRHMRVRPQCNTYSATAAVKPKNSCCFLIPKKKKKMSDVFLLLCLSVRQWWNLPGKLRR